MSQDGATLTALEYMRRPCVINGESLDWAVLGSGPGGAGVLAWCWDEDDARVARRAIAALGEYQNLTIECLA